jgi:immunoglobulin-like protein involved in spore germination
VKRALLLSALLLAGCGGHTTSSYTTTPPTTGVVTTVPATPQDTTSFLVFLVDPADGKLYADVRSVPKTDAVAAAALKALASSPHTTVPGGLDVSLANGDATVSGASLSPAAEAQVVYTLTQFPTVKTVNGKTRADVEDYAPAILVEHPAPGEEVTSPFHVTGTANTFEATFQYKLEDANGKVLAQHFVTATSGTGTRGTFDATVDFSVDAPQAGSLVVYENSAENGAVVHERTIPLRLKP